MVSQGVLYIAGKSPRVGSITLYQTPLKRAWYSSVRFFGFELIIIALVGMSLSLWPLAYREILYYTRPVQRATTSFGALIETALDKEKGQVRKEAENLGLSSYFSVYIPKINAKANVIPNVDAGNSDDYGNALKNGVAHAKGTFFPGQGNTIFLFAHSTDSPLNFAQYNAVFYLLTKLDEGDSVIMYFLDKRYPYVVKQKLIVDPSDVSWFAKKNRETLVLQTCYPPGTSLKRFLIIAEPPGQKI